MRPDRSRLLVWCCLLVAVLIMSGCFSDPEPKQKPRVDWLSAETTSDDADIIMERVTYRSGDLTISGQVCRPAGGGPYPVLISNHGGFAGLPDWDNPNGFCAQAARQGWVLAESSYRGENDSDGQIEVCLGEVDDVLAMLEVVRGQTYAEPDRVAMVGVSHGGCITSRAVERGADVDLAVDIAGPSDWAPLVHYLKRSSKSPTDPILQPLQRDLVVTIEQAVGGTPDRFPERYDERSPDAEKIAQWDKPFLIMQGAADTIVPVKQSCDLADKVGGVRAYRFDTKGDVVAKAPPGCGKLTWNDAGPGDFDADRYLLVYDEVDHFLVASNGLSKITTDLFRFFDAKLPGS